MHPVLVLATIVLLSPTREDGARMVHHYRMETGRTMLVFVRSKTGACGPFQVLPWVADGIRSAKRRAYRGSPQEAATCARLMLDPVYAYRHAKKVDRAAKRRYGPTWAGVRCGYIHGPWNDDKCGRYRRQGASVARVTSTEPKAVQFRAERQAMVRDSGTTCCPDCGNPMPVLTTAGVERKRCERCKPRHAIRARYNP